MRGDAIRSVLPMVKHSSQNTPTRYRHLVALRASVINDCRACITTHRRDARQDGFSEEEILRAEDWTNHKDSFNKEEAIVLEFTDAITHIDGYESVPDELWNEAVELFDVEDTHNLLISILAINAYNRISIATRTDPSRIKGASDFDLNYDATL